MQQVKPYLAVSLKGLYARFFDAEDDANAFAKETAKEKFVTMAVAKVIRTVDPSGIEQDRGAPIPIIPPVAAAEPVLEHANG